MKSKQMSQGELRTRAWNRGYTAGHGGNEGRTAPYLDSGFTEPLVRAWSEGYARGLEDWRAEELQKRRGEQAAREVHERTEFEAAKLAKGRAV